MFQYLISISPLGFMYGSAGAFLSPENLVGRSGAKFPPEAATLSGLMFSINKITEEFSQEQLRDNLFVAGPFWAESHNKQNFYIPIPWHKVIAKKAAGEWQIKNDEWALIGNTEAIEPDYRWQTITTWKSSVQGLRTSQKSISDNPWRFVPFLHPKIQEHERCVQQKNGLFLEYSVQMPDNICLVYLSTYPLKKGWYRFGGENHVVEIDCEKISQRTLELLSQPIGKSFALITPAVWGSNRFSYRYPQHETFPEPLKMLTDKPLPYRYRAKGNLGRGRYAVPAGSIYVLKESINKSWWEWDEAWFPKEGYSLKKVGCGLCLPVEINGVT
ncbi:CRISPR-associated protein [Nostoc sp. FACHB-110]|uniref:CRISPR-associated protein n=1 Tax=Nostoc sp. FACHB-110 TaxID=2692834 RepID=UPI00168377AC|nr:CRISPR-associated protein [Nostoc sp. FACHB-110]MBD2440576.1 CRISPR-associated protein [Nostoc sp. FACHB-110]